jgi:hypothetical protein
MKTSLFKKVGRPLGSKNKPNKKEKLPADQDARLNDLAHQQALLEHMGRIKNLEHQAIGYRAVISYLSHQLGLKQ